MISYHHSHNSQLITHNSSLLMKPTGIEVNLMHGDASLVADATPLRKFWRTCVVYQIARFFVLALKILRIVVAGHS